MCCAHHSTRGKPAQPATLDASPAPAAPSVSLCSTRPGFPRLRLWAPGLASPTAPSPALGLADHRRRSIDLPGLACGSPVLASGLGAGRARSYGQNVLARKSACSRMRPSSLLSIAQQLRAYGLLFCRSTDWLTRLRAAPRLTAAAIGLVAGSAFSAFLIPPPITATLAQAGHPATGLCRFARPFSRSPWAAASAVPVACCPIARSSGYAGRRTQEKRQRKLKPSLAPRPAKLLGLGILEAGS